MSLLIITKYPNSKSRKTIEYVNYDSNVSLENYAYIIMRKEGIDEFKILNKINECLIYVKQLKQGYIYNTEVDECLYLIQKAELKSSIKDTSKKIEK